MIDLSGSKKEQGGPKSKNMVRLDEWGSMVSSSCVAIKSITRSRRAAERETSSLHRGGRDQERNIRPRPMNEEARENGEMIGSSVVLG